MTIHPNKPLKQYDEDDWREYYSDPLHFNKVFDDYERLKNTENQSTSQSLRLDVCADIIASKLD